MIPNKVTITCKDETEHVFDVIKVYYDKNDETTYAILLSPSNDIVKYLVTRDNGEGEVFPNQRIPPEYVDSKINGSELCARNIRDDPLLDRRKWKRWVI